MGARLREPTPHWGGAGLLDYAFPSKRATHEATPMPALFAVGTGYHRLGSVLPPGHQSGLHFAAQLLEGRQAHTAEARPRSEEAWGVAFSRTRFAEPADKVVNLIGLPDRDIRPEPDRLWRFSIAHPVPPAAFADRDALKDSVDPGKSGRR